MILQREVVVSDPFRIGDDSAFAELTGALEPADAGQHIGALVGDDAELHSIRVVRYKPGKRCLIEYRFHVAGEQIRVLGKMRFKGLDRKAYEAQLACWRAGMPVPEPLGVVPAYAMWVQRAVPGTDVMTSLLADGRVDDGSMAGIAELIYRLHRSDVPTRRSHGMCDELAILHERLGRLASERPAMSGRIARLLLAVERGATKIQPGPDGGIHRDFYPDQVMRDGRDLWLVDLDLFVRGDAALDIGNFSGHLIELGMRLTGNPLQFRDEQDAFERRYIDLAGESVRCAVEFYTTLTLARHVQISTLFTERRHTTMPLLDLCEERLRYGELQRSNNRFRAW